MIEFDINLDDLKVTALTDPPADGGDDDGEEDGYYPMLISAE